MPQRCGASSLIPSLVPISCALKSGEHEGVVRKILQLLGVSILSYRLSSCDDSLDLSLNQQVGVSAERRCPASQGEFLGTRSFRKCDIIVSGEFSKCLPS